MNIAADSFTEIFAALTSSANATPTKDKRRSTRYAYPANILITPCDADGDGEPVMVGLTNFSARGLCIIYDQSLPLRSQFIAELPRKEEPSVHMLCTIIHVHPQSRGDYALGAEFTCVVSREPKGKAPVESDVERIRRSILT